MSLDLKVGDKVTVISRYVFRISKVEKITPKGFIKVDGTLYTPDGRERGSDVWSASSIRPTTTEDVEYIYTKDVIKKLKEIRELSYEQACEINEILERGSKNDD